MKQLILLSLICLIAGCGPRPYLKGNPDVPGPPPQLQFSSQTLRNDLQVGKVLATTDSAGILTVIVPLHSISSKAYSIDWRVTFLDGLGRPMGPATGWSQMMLSPNTTIRISANSLQPGAKDYQMDLRRSE